MSHPLLNPGDVIWKGESDHVPGRYCVLYYNPDVETNRAAFKDALPVLTKLGFEIVPHWKPKLREEGHKATKEHIEIRRIGVDMNERDYHFTEICPIVMDLMEGKSLDNDLFSNKLLQKGEAF